MQINNMPFLEAGVAAVLCCENQSCSLASSRPGETDGDWINTTLENWDLQSDWYICKRHKQRFTGCPLALLNVNTRESWEGKRRGCEVAYLRSSIIRCPRETSESWFPRPHWFPYYVPVSVQEYKANRDSRSFSCVFVWKQLELHAQGIMAVWWNL